MRVHGRLGAQALLDREIREVLHGWRECLSRAALVFVHAPSANAAPLFGGEAPALQRSDLRVRSVPFTTRRPTFMEAKRVAAALLTVHPATLPQPGARHFSLPPMQCCRHSRSMVRPVTRMDCHL